MEKIIATVPDGVALLDANRRIELANATAQSFLNILAGTGVGDVVDQLGEHPVERLLNYSNDATWHEIRLAGSSQRVFEVSISPVRPDSGLSNGASTEWLLMIRDVTTEREIQQRVQLQDRLAAVGQFAAGMAHDFNKLLTSVILGAQILGMSESSLLPRGSERLDTIQQQAKRASELIKQALDFSRASEMEMHPFDLMSPLKELVKLLERMLPESIRLELSYPPGDFTIQGDATHILQMLMNLTLNARDAMPEGGSLRVELD